LFGKPIIFPIDPKKLHKDIKKIIYEKGLFLLNNNIGNFIPVNTTNKDPIKEIIEKI
jgi:hypothetical protein